MIEPTSLAVPARPVTRSALSRHSRHSCHSRQLAALSQAFRRLPQSLIALLARLSIAAELLSLVAGGPGAGRSTTGWPGAGSSGRALGTER